MRRIAISTVALCALLAPTAAQAHVTLQPDEAAAGSYAVLDVRVPNETEDANTVKVEVRLPAGFAQVSYQPVPGWTVKVNGGREIVWTGDGEQGKIAPGQFQDFPMSVQIPSTEGDTLTFKALQTYDNGEVVRWIGAPDSEEPAPQVTVTAAEPEGGHGHEEEAGDEAQSVDEHDGASMGLGVAALAIGALGLLAGGAALLRVRTT